MFSRVLTQYLIMICMPTIMLHSVNKMVFMPVCNMENWLSVTDNSQYCTCAPEAHFSWLCHQPLLAKTLIFAVPLGACVSRWPMNVNESASTMEHFTGSNPIHRQSSQEIRHPDHAF